MKIRPMGLAIHEFNIALRKLSNDISRAEFVKSVVSSEFKTMKSAAKNVGILIVGLLLLQGSMQRDVLAFTIMGQNLALSGVLVVFLLSLYFLLFVFDLLGIVFNHVLLSNLARKLYNIDDVGTIRLLFGGTDSSAFFSFRGSSILSPPGAYFFMLAAIFVVVGSVLAVSFLFLPYELLTIVFDLLFYGQTNNFETMILLLSCTFVFLALVLIIAQFVPITLRKHTEYIRWNFLYPMYVAKGLRPPLVSNWVKRKHQA